MEKKNFLSIFHNKKPVFGMLHLKGEGQEAIFEQAKHEIDLYIEGGVDAIIVENYFGNYYDMENILQYLQDTKKDIIYGVNCLHVDPMGFYLAKKYNATFIQLDSICGHLKVRDDPGFDEFIKLCRNGYDGYILGGVRFKYQPYKSGRTLEEDLNIGKTRCDAIVVTQDATGQETSLDKIQEFRAILGEFPLVIGAGMTPENCEKQLALADAAIVGSYFKDTYKDDGDVDITHIQSMVNALDKIRGGIDCDKNRTN